MTTSDSVRHPLPSDYPDPVKFHAAHLAMNLATDGRCRVCFADPSTTSDSVRPLTAYDPSDVLSPHEEAWYRSFAATHPHTDASVAARRLLATLDEARAGSLDAAWQEAEAALPEGWRFGLSPYYPEGVEAYAYDIHQTPTSARSDHSTGAIYGDTPAAALRALAAALREAQP